MFTSVKQNGVVRIVPTAAIVSVSVVVTAGSVQTALSILVPGFNDGVETLGGVQEVKEHRTLSDAVQFAQDAMESHRKTKGKPS